QPKVVVYHQSLHSESGVPTSLRPLVREETGITALILGSFHICMDHKVTSSDLQGNESNSSATMYLNDFALEDPNIEDIWVDVKYLQTEGVKVIGTLNMYEVDSLGSCDDLTFERSYNVLHDVVVSRRLDGFNLDTEVRGEVVNAEDERMSLQAINRLIDRLNTDFGSNFIIVMTASAEALLGTDGNQKGTEIDYRALETQRGHLISWYNVRIFSPYERSGDHTNEIRLPPDKILMAVSTTPNAGDGTVRGHGPYIDSLRLRRILELLRWSYSPVAFGGVAGWEYSPVRGSTAVGHPGGSRSPWLWA
ncbi:glycoside hydrolase superfamily, partial [Usnea florida]